MCAGRTSAALLSLRPIFMTKSEQRAYHAQWYQKNKKRKNAQSRAWRKKNPERQKFLSRRNYLRNRKKRIRQAVKAARKRSSTLEGRKKLHDYNSKRWHSKTKKQKLTAAQRVEKWKREHPRKAENTRLKCHYGLSLKEFYALRKSQNNRCAICRKRFRKTPHVDHDHETKRIRGLLCGPCNTGLGMFKDSNEFLTRAASYLKEIKCLQ